MTPAFFARLTLGNVSLEDLADEYQDWAVGEGPFERQRRGREQNGLPRNATADALDHSDDLTGTNDFAISIRHGEGITLLRLVHRDSVDDGVLWHNVVRLTAHGTSTTIEHAIARTAPRGVVLQPRAASPAVVKDLIDLHRADITPKDLYKARVTCSDATSAETFASHVLLAKDRDVPLVIVTPAARAGVPGVDSELLARTLRGTAGIVELTTRAATDALTFELEHAGLDRTYSCFDGGVRLYMPPLSAKDERYKHPLWIRSWLESLASDRRDRTERLAGIISGRIAETTLPSDLLHCIQDFDREQRRKVVDTLITTPSVPANALANTMLSESGEKANAEALKQEIRDANDLIEVYANDNQDLSNQVAALRQELAEREFAIQQATLRAETLEQIIEAKKRELNSGVPPEVRDAIAALLSKELTPEIALQLVSITWPERVIVLDTAYKAAKKSESFEDPEQVLHLLTKLATEYIEALGNGGDAKAKSVFGKKEFAPTEAGLTKEGQKLRTFVYKDKKVEMLPHLKIGVKMDSFAKTLRIHFHWDGKDKKLVIGHCGPHLDL